MSTAITYEILTKLVNMSVTASIAVAAILLIRLLLKKAPKVYSYLLWFIVLFRLLCPVSVSSDMSLMRFLDTPVTEEGMIEYIPSDYSGQNAMIPESLLSGKIFNSNGIMSDGTASDGMISSETALSGADSYDMEDAQNTESFADSANLLEVMAGMGTVLWSIGIAAMVLYSTVSLVLLKRKLIGSVEIEKNIYRADHIVSPFVIGIFRPRIYLPSNLSESEREYILLHEKHHIKRCDHIFKLVFYTVLCVYWFNPIIWLAFYLFVKDMEMSCDEAVMSRMTSDIRADYSQSLLCLATGRRIISGTPLAFGEGNTGDRIKNVLNWKKPKTWVAAAAVLLCAVTAVCLITNPKADASENDGQKLDINGSINPQNDNVVMDQPNDIDGEEDYISEYYTAVDKALREAVIEHNKEYSMPADFSCASFLVFSYEENKDEDTGEVVSETFYGRSLYKDMNLGEEGITEVVTVTLTLEVTLSEDGEGGYVVEECRDLTRDDFMQEGFLDEKFPGVWLGGEFTGTDILDFSSYDKILAMDCHAQAVEYGNLDTDAIIDGLVTYMTDIPMEFSNPRDYINGFYMEYREILLYGPYTLDYADRYRRSGAEDLKMAILDCAVEDIEEIFSTLLYAYDENFVPYSYTSEFSGEEAELQRAEEELREQIENMRRLEEELLEQTEIEALQREEAELQAQLEQLQREEEILQEQIAREQAERIRSEMQEIPDFLFTMVWPTVSYEISQTFGERQHYSGETLFSDHINIAGEQGDLIYAAFDGTVETIGFTADYGNYIVILSDNEIRTRYGHLQSVDVTEGASVTAGDVIGTMGKTGRATGYCLHFAITDHNEPVDPLGGLLVICP